MNTSSLTTGVSFATTPLAEVSTKAKEIEALGWVEVSRADPWAVSYRKDFPTDEESSDAEVQDVMGDYLLDADAIEALLASKSG